MTEYYAAVVKDEGIFGVGITEGEAIGRAVEYFASLDIPISKGEITIQTIEEDLYHYILVEYGGVVPKEEHLKRWGQVKKEPYRPATREEQFDNFANFITGGRNHP